MQLITAIIKKRKLDAVADALSAQGVGGMTVTEVLGYGSQKGTTQVFRGRAVQGDFLRKTRVDVIVNDEEVDQIIDVIVQAAHSGAIGDGKVWSTPVGQVVRVRTGERGAEAV